MTTAAIESTRPSRIRGWWPFGPIFGKELRQMARRKRSYALRFGYLAVLLCLLGFAWLVTNDSYRWRDNSLVMQAQRQAELGHTFFAVFAIFSVIAMLLMGPVLTSAAIGAERLRRTFDVLLMTPISAWQLVTGKLFSQLLSAFVLLGISLPVLAIVRLLGGVEIENLLGAIALAACTATASAALGLLLSCWNTRAWVVILLAYLIEFAFYFLLPMLGVYLIYAAYRSNFAAPVWMFETIGAINPLFTASSQVLGGAGQFGTWLPACLVQLGIALALTTLSAMVVRKISRREAAGAATTGAAPALAPSGATPPPLGSSPSGRSHRPVSDHPVLWLEWRKPLMRKRSHRIIGTVLVIGLMLLTYAIIAMDNGFRDRDTHVGYAFVLHTLLLLMCLVLSATAVASDKESDTWTVLLTTPLSGRSVVWAKFLGVLRKLMWPWLVLAGHFAIFTVFGNVKLVAMLIVLFSSITFNLVWIAAGIYISLKASRATTAIVVTMLVPVLFYAVVPLGLAALEAATGFYGDDDLPSIVLYYVPYWFMGESISRRGDQYQLPLSWDRVPGVAFLTVTVISGAVQCAIAGGLLHLASKRFDRVVKRAPG